MLTKDAAICIRAIDYSETSQIVTFFTKETGKVTAIAKGSKRPKSAFDGTIEVFACGKIVFSDSSDKSDSSKEKLATLTEFQQQPIARMGNNLFALNCCLFAMELLDRLTDDYDPHSQLFDSFLRFLQDANEHQASSIEHRDILSLLILFQLSLLKEVGLIPILDYCVNCKTTFEHRLSAVASAKAEVSRIEHQVYFSSAANGLVCKDCEASFPDKIRLTKKAADCLSNLKLIADADEKTLNEIEKVLIHHFTELLHKPPKMAKYVIGGS